MGTSSQRSTLRTARCLISFVITDYPSLDYLERRDVCLGLQFWEPKGMAPASAELLVEAMCSLNSGGKHRASVDERSSQ